MFFAAPYTFLTTKPQKRLLSVSHPEWLAVLPIVDISIPKLQAIVTFTDGTTSTYDLTTTGEFLLSAGQVQCFDISYATRDYDSLNEAKTIRSFKISIYSPDFSTSDYIECVPYTPKGDLQQAIYYHNSYGGLDSLICTGDAQTVDSVQGMMTNKVKDDSFVADSSQVRFVNPSFIRSRKLDTGLKPSGEIDALHDLLTIKQAYEYRIVNGNPYFVPIVPEGSPIEYPSLKNTLKRMAISYRYSQIYRAIDRIGV